MTAWVVDRLLAWRMALLLAAALLAAVCWIAARQLSFDRSIENMFPSDSRLLEDYRLLPRVFGGNEIVLAVYQDAGLFAADGSGIRRLSGIRRQLQQTPGVRAVLSIDQPLGEELIVGHSALAAATRELFCGFTHGADNRTVSVVCLLEPTDQTEVPRRETIDRLRQLMQSLPDGLASGWLTGEPVLVVDGFRYVEQDGRRLGRWSAVLLGLTIIVCFRSLRWVLIPIAVVQLALWMTRALLSALQLRLSMVSSMLTAVVLVVGVATMVHVIVRYHESRSLGLSTEASLRRTGQLLAAPVFWACLTDAVGFLALTVSRVGPVQDFGLMMSIGAMMVLVSAALLVPGLALWGSFDTDPRSPWGEDRLLSQLRGLLRVVQRRPYALLAAILLTVAGAVWGIGRLQVETDFTRNFRADSEIAQAYNFVEDHLGGAGVCDIVIPAPAVLDWSFLSRVQQLEHELNLPSSDPAVRPAITKSFSLADAVVALSPVKLDQQPRLLRDFGVGSGLVAMRGWMPEFYDTLYGQDPVDGQHYFRLMLRVHERESAQQKERLIERLQDKSQQLFPQARVTGYYVLLADLINSILRDQWRTFCMAVLGIGVLMGLAFRDVRLVLIALVPNALPILIVLGGMGWASVCGWPELKINMGTAMIAAVSMGLSIDSSIHYISAFQRARRAGLGFDEALQSVQQNVGKAMVLSTVALIVGFSVLATSRFIPTVYFGTLVSLAMLGGLLGNLVMLPLLLRLSVGRRSD